MLCTRLGSETELGMKCRDPGSPATNPLSRPLLKTFAGRWGFCGGIHCFCTPAAPLHADHALGKPALRDGMWDCE